MKTGFRRIALLGVVVAASAFAQTAHAEKYALLVGMTKTPSAPREKWLNGPANDVEMMRTVLVSTMGFKDENIMTVGGTPECADATAAGITKAFRTQLIEKTKPGDYALFFYSGHGTELPDQNGDEADGKDEALVPFDAGNTIQSYISDDQLGDWTSQIKASETLVILDSCHSGTGLRGGGGVPKFLNAEDLGFKWPVGANKSLGATFKQLVNKNPKGTGNSGFEQEIGQKRDATATNGAPHVILLSGCRADQTSEEKPYLLSDDEKEQQAFLEQYKKDHYCVGTKVNPFIGALTFMILRAILTSPKGLSYTELHKKVALDLQKAGLEQVPQLEGEGTDKPAFAATDEAPATPTAPTPAVVTPPAQTAPPVQPAPPTPATPVTPPVAVKPPATQAPLNGVAAQVISVAGDTAQIQVGPPLELVPGSIFESASGAALRVLSATGTARIVRGSVRAGDKLYETFHFVATKKLRVALLGDGPNNAKATLSQRIGALDFVQIVEAGAPHEAELEFSQRGGAGDSLRLNLYRNQQQLPAISGADVDEVFPKIGRALENLYTVNQLVAMDNPKAAMKVDLQVNGKDFETIKINDTIAFTARAERDCYLYLVDVDPAGKVTVLFPNKYAGNNKLRGGETTNLPAPNLYRLRVAGPAGGEAVKAIVTESPLRLEVLEAAGGEIAALQGNGSDIATALLAQLKRELNGGARGIEVLPGDPRSQPITTEGWATDIVLLTIKD